MPILGFNPAAPSNTPGICLAPVNWIPCDSGMEAAPSVYDVGADAVGAAVQGAFLGQKVDGSYRLFAGTGTKLYEKSSGSWTDRSVGAGTYTAGSEWSFCQFGDATIASNLSEAMQVSTTGAFAAITGPKAKVVESVVTSGGGFVFAFNTSDGTYGTGQTDRWWCSAVNDHATWTVSTATQCNTGRLVGAGGPIIAAKRFGQDQIVAYKNSALYIGRYVGGDAVWQWSDIQEVGAVGPRAVCDIGYAHFIVSPNGFWIFDGSRPTRIGAEVRDWFLANVDFANIAKTECIYDWANNRVLVFFRTSGASSLNRCLVWHLQTQQWGLANYSIETSCFYVPPALVMDDLSGTMDALTGTFDSSPPSKKLVAVFGTNHKVGTLTGVPGTSSFQTGDKGDPRQVSRLTECYVSYAIRPTTAKCRVYTSSMLGGTEGMLDQRNAYDVPGSINTPGRFTPRACAKFLRVEYEFTGACRITDEGAKLTPAGSR
jgi:hypothetical protein